MNGSGFVPYDLFLVVLCYAATVASFLKLRDSSCMPAIFRLAGWFVLSVRLSDLMFSMRDLPIGLPSLVGLTFLAAAEITAAAVCRRPR